MLPLSWKAYKFMDNVSGQFCVDEKENRIYIIKDYVNDDENEIFSLVRYSL